MLEGNVGVTTQPGHNEENVTKLHYKLCYMKAIKPVLDAKS